ncbi:hypothetical protein MNBD_GAMMA17-830 [hydrothermal vent metagenome]|uniref:J domain-containing protein n=1 Tax=hydrothermal vent metagenome TaxID=652676 RepID=A0A3B0Z917_9ZZZZ
MLDPYLVLNLSRTPSDEEVRSAYLKAVRENPPEQDAECFQAIQAAYEAIKTHRLRLKHQLFCADPVSPTELLSQATRTATPSRPSLSQFQALLRHGLKSVR